MKELHDSYLNHLLFNYGDNQNKEFLNLIKKIETETKAASVLSENVNKIEKIIPE